MNGRLVTFARTELFAAIRRAESSISLVSPFLSRPVADRLAAVADESNAASRRLITALNAFSVRAGVLDPSGLASMYYAGFEIRNVANLHAKVALVDGAWGLVGSGNLTNAGLGPDASECHARANVELGVVLTHQQVAAASRLFEQWWAIARCVSREDISAYEALPRFPRDRDRLADEVPEVEVPTNDAIESILVEPEAIAAARKYWMKAAYFRRGQDADGWWLRGWISDRRRAPYRVDDLVVLYLGGDGSPQCCPAILRVLKEPREDADFVEHHGRGPVDRKWPFVTETQCVFDIPIRQAPRPEAFGIDPRSTQPGYRRLSRDQFEEAARALTSV